MSGNNQNFIIGLISALALVAGLIYTILQIQKLTVDLRDPKSAKHNRRIGKNDKATRTRIKLQSSVWGIGFIVDIFFFLVFLSGSINAILNYLANEVPKFAITALVFVLIYSIVLIEVPNNRSEDHPIKKRSASNVAGWVGLVVTSSIFAMLGIQRLLPVFVGTSVYGTTVAQLFSLVVNLAIVPLLAFSLVSVQRIIRYVSNAIIAHNGA